MSSGSLPTFSADSHGQRPLSPNMIPMLASLIVATVVFTSCSRSSAQIAKSGPTMVARLTPENWNDLVPRGKEVDAIYGDIVLRNELITAVIANPASTRNANMTVKSVGGCLIDLAVNDAASDQLSAFYPGRRVFRFEDGVSVGSHGKSVTLGGVTATASTSELTIQSRGGGSQPDCVVKYSIEGGKPYVKISSTWTNTSDKEIKLTLEDDLRADGGKEDMPKVPNGTHELFWFQDIHWQQAYGVSAPGYTIRCNSNARESVLSYEAVDGRDMILKPGASFEFVRHVYVAKDLPLVLAMHEEESGRGANHRNVTLVVQDHQAKPVTGARVELKVNGHSRGIAVSDQEGKIQTALPTGDGLAEVSLAGLNFASSKFRIEDTTSNIPIKLDEYTPGTAMITVTDAEGRSIPAKVEFDGSGDTQTPNWGPETAEHFVRNLAYTPDGKVQATLASGTYDLIISHGPEYDAEFTKLQVDAGKTSEVQVKLSRVVNTTGWVSADFHSHSSPSGDNTGSQLGRVLNLAAEHVEFAPCTEHNRISTYVDHIQSQNLGAFLSTVSGMELTGSPLPLNHQNAFPLIYKPRTQDGGAPTPDGSPETQVERLAAWDNNSEKLIQQNHPDIGWLFYDKDGNQEPDTGYSRSFEHINVMEIHPIDPILDLGPLDSRNGKPFGNSRMFNWLQLLNQGFRIYGVVNTDSHYNFHGSGGLRLWLKSSTDDPAEIDSDEMKSVSRAGNIIMSNGPFIEFTLADSAKPDDVRIAGQDLAASSGKLNARIKVQTPNWFDIDTVFVLVNGRKRDDLTFTRDTHPDMFTTSTVKFDQTLSFPVESDAHVIVVTGHRTELLGDVQGPAWGAQHPAALSNPVFVDVDGDGFKASKDTLDHPLPVKFVAK